MIKIFATDSINHFNVEFYQNGLGHFHRLILKKNLKNWFFELNSTLNHKHLLLIYNQNIAVSQLNGFLIK